MKVLITADTAGGVWQYAMDLVACLLEEQMEVALVAMGPDFTSTQQAQVRLHPEMTFYYHPYQLEWMDDPWKDIEAAGHWLKSIYFEEKPDLIHFNHYAHVDMEWDCPVLLVAHSCVGTWWKAVKKEPLPSHFNRYFDIVRGAFQSADAIVSPSAAMLDQYRQVYGVLKNTHVIYNGITPPEAISYEKKEPMIFSMGRLWDEAKNIHLLLEAAQHIHGRIYVAGKKPQTIAQPPNVTFLGELGRKEVFQWLDKAAVYALPVRYEPFGLSFLEAASHKCALVGGNIPTLHELWQDGMTYVDPNDAIELAKACNTLLDSRNYCRSMGEEAYAKAGRYTLKKKKDQYLELYNEMLAAAMHHYNYDTHEAQLHTFM